MSKTSWEYQKGRYKQLNIKFRCDSLIDMKIYSYLNENNASEVVKKLVWSKIDPCYGCFGASFNDCGECEVDRNES